EVNAAGVHAVPAEIGEGAGAPKKLDRSDGGGSIWAGEGDDELLQGVERAAAVLAGVDAPQDQGEPPRVARALSALGLGGLDGVNVFSLWAERPRRGEGLQHRQSVGPQGDLFVDREWHGCGSLC